MLSMPAFCLSFVASRRINENAHSNGKIGHKLCPFTQNQDEKRSQTLFAVKIRVFRGPLLLERLAEPNFTGLACTLQLERPITDMFNKGNGRVDGALEIILKP